MLLDIAILSYNRTEELKRCLNSLVALKRDSVRVVVYEDCSPDRIAIKKIVDKYCREFSVPLVFEGATQNLGYDRNLLRALETGSRYTLLLSDDDYVDPFLLDCLIGELEAFSGNVLLCPFVKNGTLYRNGRHFKGAYSKDVLYDSVLFSGVVLRNQAVTISDSQREFIENSIYSQVFLVGFAWCDQSRYFEHPVILVGEDGENYFGVSKASADKVELQDRSAYDSNLDYQQFFQKVSFFVLEKYYPEILASFLHSYSLRLVSHFMRVKLSDSGRFWSAIIKLPSRELRFNRYYVYPLLTVLAILPRFLCKRVYRAAISRFRVSGG